MVRVRLSNYIVESLATSSCYLTAEGHRLHYMNSNLKMI